MAKRERDYLCVYVNLCVLSLSEVLIQNKIVMGRGGISEGGLKHLVQFYQIK